MQREIAMKKRGEHLQRGSLPSCNRGVGILEVAGVIVIFLILALSGFGIVDLVQRKSRLALLVERNLNDQNIKSLILEEGLSHFNEEEMRAALLRLLEKTSDEVKSEFNVSKNGDARIFRLEVQAVEILIDTAHGTVKGIHERPQLILREGALMLPSSLQREYDFTKEFERLAGSTGTKSPYAYPSGIYGTDNKSRFLPRILLLGMRAFVSFEGTFTDSVISTLGFQEFPITAEIRVAPLRGEIGGL